MEEKESGRNRDGPDEIEFSEGGNLELKKVKKKLRRKISIVCCIVLAIVVVGIGGAWVAHEQPASCAALCHDTMGYYLETYEDSNYLVNEHSQVGVVCLDCHEADLATQLEEVKTQISGEYRLPLAKMETDDGFCLRDGCHTRDEIVAATDKYTFTDGTTVNVHALTFSTEYNDTQSPHEVGGSTISCSTCHTAHRESKKVEYCFSCHHTKTFNTCNSCHDHR